MQLPCSQQSYSGVTSARRKQRKHHRTSSEKSNVMPSNVPAVIVNSSTNAVRDQPHSKFSLTGTSEFIDSHDKIISDARELQLMQDFINKKVIAFRYYSLLSNRIPTIDTLSPFTYNELVMLIFSQSPKITGREFRPS